MEPKPLSSIEQTRVWVNTWKAAGPALEEIRNRELASIDTPTAVHQIFGASAGLFRGLPPRLTSGLVEQQAWFAKLRE